MITSFPCGYCKEPVIFRPDLCQSPGRTGVLWEEKYKGHPNYVPTHTHYWHQETMTPFCGPKCSLEWHQENIEGE